MTRLAAALALLALSGCALLTSPVTAVAGIPYGATRMDVVFALEGHESELSVLGTLLGVLDLPLSLSLDTALAPLALTRYAVLEAERRDAQRRPWGERAFEAQDLGEHPALVAACGDAPAVEVLGEHQDPERTVLEVRGERGTRMVWVTRVRDPDDPRETRGLAVEAYRGRRFTAVLWTPAGTPRDLLR